MNIKDYIEFVELRYQRLPGYEHLSHRAYVKLMHEKLEQRRQKVVAERKAKGLGFVGREKLLKVKRGAIPKNTKTSEPNSYRPRVLSKCPQRRRATEIWYFGNYSAYKEASRKFRAGDDDVQFPPGMYPPWRPRTPVKPP